MIYDLEPEILINRIVNFMFIDPVVKGRRHPERVKKAAVSGEEKKMYFSSKFNSIQCGSQDGPIGLDPATEGLR